MLSWEFIEYVTPMLIKKYDHLFLIKYNQLKAYLETGADIIETNI